MGAKRIILLVEDNETHRQVVSELLEDEGYDVRAVGSCLDAQNVLDTVAPEIIIVDMRLGADNMAGLELIRDVRRDQRLEGIPVLLISAYLTSQLRERHGAVLDTVEVLEKPFDFDQLHTVVKRLLAKRRRFVSPQQEEQSEGK